jgi:hypothetical protein
MIMFAGVGTGELGLGNEDIQENVFFHLRPDPRPLAFLVSLAVLTSSASSLQSTFVGPPARSCRWGTTARCRRRSRRSARASSRPGYATIVSAIVASAFYAVMRVVSENTLWDTILTLGMMICFYYGITAFACVWYFRHQWFDSVRNVFFTFLFPLVGGSSSRSCSSRRSSTRWTPARCTLGRRHRDRLHPRHADHRGRHRPHDLAVHQAPRPSSAETLGMDAPASTRRLKEATLITETALLGAASRPVHRRGVGRRFGRHVRRRTRPPATPWSRSPTRRPKTASAPSTPPSPRRMPGRPRPRTRSDIRRAFDLLTERADEFALLMTLEMGKPLAGAARSPTAASSCAGSARRRCASPAASGRTPRAPAAWSSASAPSAVLLHHAVELPLAMATRKIAPRSPRCPPSSEAAGAHAAHDLAFVQLLVEAAFPPVSSTS